MRDSFHGIQINRPHYSYGKIVLDINCQLVTRENQVRIFKAVYFSNVREVHIEIPGNCPETFIFPYRMDNLVIEGKLLGVGSLTTPIGQGIIRNQENY